MFFFFARLKTVTTLGAPERMDISKNVVLGASSDTSAAENSLTCHIQFDRRLGESAIRLNYRNALRQLGRLDDSIKPNALWLHDKKQDACPL